MNSAVSDSLVYAARATACAKINLTLDVLGGRDDGYHELRSLVVGVDLRDEIVATGWDDAGFVLDCSDRRLAGSDNLVALAVHELAGQCAHNPAARIELAKRIPVGAGLGGGSSDAAAALRLCDRIWGLGLGDPRLAEIGSRLGSDVPLFFSLPAAVITGRGECVEPVTMRWSGWVLLVFTGVEVPTTEVYAQWRPTDSPRSDSDSIGAILEATSAERLSALVRNDLRAAVFRVSPETAGICQILAGLGYGPLTVSGAGSTMYRLFDDKDEACRVASDIEAAGPGVTTAVVAAPVGQDPINMSLED